MASFLLGSPKRSAIPVTPLQSDGLAAWLKGESAAVRTWVRQAGFKAEPGSVCLVPAADGRIGRVLAGIGADNSLWDWAALPARLPKGVYRIAAPLDAAAGERAAIGWGLACYRFERYRKSDKPVAALVVPAGCDAAAVDRTVRATALVRDLINTPANDMGPDDLAETARRLATRHKARCRVVKGDALIRQDLPAIHAVGRASGREPRLIDLRWGAPSAPKVTLVGKGVCFDTGGLDLKPASGMKLMKKDMGGAATMLGLAKLIMEAQLPVSLRVLIPAVENSVSGDAMRPLDVIDTRKGLTVEIGNTDAEGRLVLADALTLASEDKPDLLIDAATLTGAARVALGTEVPAFFCADDAVADALAVQAGALEDPVWRLPLWTPYRRHLDGAVADLTNAPDGGYGGAITAALFLSEFVGEGIPWIHVDMMAWNQQSRPGRPEGGEAQGMRALFGLIRARYDAPS